MHVLPVYLLRTPLAGVAIFSLANLLIKKRRGEEMPDRDIAECSIDRGRKDTKTSFSSIRLVHYDAIGCAQLRGRERHVSRRRELSVTVLRTADRTVDGSRIPEEKAPGAKAESEY
jgi:hypothetical protein